MNKMIEIIDENDIVIASRYMEGSGQIGVSKMRKFLSFCVNKLLVSFFRIENVKDYTSGYRMYKMQAIKKYVTINNCLPVSHKGFPATAEILLKLGESGAICSGVPLVLRYDFKEGKSSINIVKTIFGYIYLFTKQKCKK
jgi:dolichol-phosphate mannosyltransferase